MQNWLQVGNPQGPTFIVVFCPRCGLENNITCEVEFGAVMASDDWCGRCGRAFEGSEPWYVDFSKSNLPALEI